MYSEYDKNDVVFDYWLSGYGDLWGFDECLRKSDSHPSNLLLLLIHVASIR